jgi:DNA polymerase III subunit gamma/tau
MRRFANAIAICVKAASLYEPLHHKYRPQTFAQLVGQGAIATTLTHALQQNRIAPAYLFCGPRGTGKTSSARILAKSLNCLKVDAPTPEPCGQCDLCLAVNRGNALDIVEIDAASNTGVDNIRELIERAQFAPVQCRYKLFVLDEVHMLSTAAFNALLKTLEEPPDRVVFVLATTDPQRVLPTIISRCQRFDFRRIPLSAMLKHLSYIAGEENIKIADSAVQLVAQIAQGGLRDAESLLDQLSLQADEITIDSVWDLVGAVPERDLLNLGRAIAADDGTILIERVRHLMDKGREPLIVLQSMVGFYRDLLIAKNAPAREDLVAITATTWAEMTEFAKNLSASQLLASQQKLQQAEGQIKNTTQPRLWLEITLTGLLPSALKAGVSSGETAKSSFSVAPRAIPTIVSSPTASPALAAPAQPAVEPAAIAQSPKPVVSEPVVSEPVVLEPVVSEPVVPESAASITLPVQPEEVQSPVEPPAEPPIAEIAFGSLSDLWNKILAALQPRGTQMLMSQQGLLLGFDGVSAKVGFRSATLQRMAQERVPNLEAALESIFQRPIRVSLEVIAPVETLETVESDSQAAQNQPPSAQPEPTPGADLLFQNQSGPTSSQRHDELDPIESEPLDNLSNSNNIHGATNETANSPSSGLPSDKLDPRSAPSPASPTADRWQSNQDQDNVKRFAQFFNGQIVNLDDDLTDPPDSSPPDSPTDRKPSDPGPDVPF